MADDVGDCVSLAGARRTLYDNALAVLQLLDYRNLFFVIGIGK